MHLTVRPPRGPGLIPGNGGVIQWIFPRLITCASLYTVHSTVQGEPKRRVAPPEANASSSMKINDAYGSIWSMANKNSTVSWQNKLVSYRNVHDLLMTMMKLAYDVPYPGKKNLTSEERNLHQVIMMTGELENFFAPNPAACSGTRYIVDHRDEDLNPGSMLTIEEPLSSLAPL